MSVKRRNDSIQEDNEGSSVFGTMSPKAHHLKSYLPSMRNGSIVLKESQLKVLQLEHDLKLKEMKLQIQEMQSNTQMDDFKNSIM